MVNREDCIRDNISIGYYDMEGSLTGDELNCHLGIGYPTFCIGKKGFQILNEISQHTGGVCDERLNGEGQVHVTQNEKCTYCENSDVCFYFYDRIGTKLNIFICNKCIPVCVDICEQIEENIDYLEQNFKILNVSEDKKIKDSVNDLDKTKSENILIVGRRGPTTCLSNIHKLIKIFDKPDNYKNINTGLDDNCSNCEEYRKDCIKIGHNILCDECMGKIKNSLEKFVDNNESYIISRVL